MKMKKNRILALLLALAMCLALGACGNGGNEEPKTDGEGGNGSDTSNALKLGFIGPTTGGAALYGKSASQGAQIAVDEINAKGGMQIELLVQDDEHDAEKSVNAYQKLKDLKAQAIVGCVTTTPCNAVAPEAYRDRMFLLTPSASSPKVVENKDNVFQMCFSDPNQGKLSAQYIKEHNLATKVAVIHNSADAYSDGIYSAFKATADEIGLEIVSDTSFTEDTATDFSVQINAAKDAGAELIFLPIYYTPASLILAQAAAVNYDVKYFGCDGMDGILGMEGFDTKLAEGMMLLTPFAADKPDELTQSFVEKYKSAYGEVPSQFAADGYDCVYAIYNALEGSDIDVSSISYSDLCEKLVEAFVTETDESGAVTKQGLTYTGLTGTEMTWGKSGEVSKDPVVYQIENGSYVEMK